MALALLLSVFAATPGCAQTSDSGACSKETDKFEGVTKVRCEYVDISVEQQPRDEIFVARAMLVSLDSTGPVILLYSRSADWNFLSEESAYALVDGARKEWKLIKIERKVRDSGATEELYAVPVNERELREISKSKRLRMKVGTAVYDLSATPISSHATELLRKL